MFTYCEGKVNFRQLLSQEKRGASHIISGNSCAVFASGGAGTLEHFYKGGTKGGTDVLLAASVFHFRTFTVRQVKEYLQCKGVKVNQLLTLY
jgi:imidazole glycerol phosphate synthase subunit HisF